MNLIHVNCPKCREPIQIDAPGRKLIWPLLAAVLVGVVIGVAGLASVLRHAPTQKAWVPSGPAQELKDLLPSTSEQELAQGIVRSKSWDKKSLLIIHNKTAQTLRVCWINYDGQRETGHEMEPFGSFTSESYATHPFLVLAGVSPEWPLDKVLKLSCSSACGGRPRALCQRGFVVEASASCHRFS